jgi:hypothetical protein
VNRRTFVRASVLSLLVAPFAAEAQLPAMSPESAGPATTPLAQLRMD